MRCKNCGSDAGKKANKHVKSHKYTCKRTDSSGSYVDSISVVGISDWSYTDESSGSSWGSGSSE